MYLRIPVFELSIHVASNEQGASLGEQLPPSPVLELEVGSDVVLDDTSRDALLAGCAEVLALHPSTRSGLDNLHNLSDSSLANFLCSIRLG